MRHADYSSAVHFASERLGFAPDQQQARVLDPLVMRGIVCGCRRWGKSTVAALKAVHHAATRSSANVLIVSPNQRRSTALLRKAEEFVQRLGQETHGDGLNRASLQLRNGSRIIVLADEQIVVRGVDEVSLLIIDDAAEVSDRAYRAVRPYLAMPGGRGGALWLMSTPYGRCGFFYRVWEHGGPRWLRIKGTAKENPRFSRPLLDQERHALGDRQYRRQYECEFPETVENYSPVGAGNELVIC